MGNLCPSASSAVTFEPSVEEYSGLTRRNTAQKEKMMKSASRVGGGSYNAFDSGESSSESDNEKAEIKGKIPALTRFKIELKDLYSGSSLAAKIWMPSFRQDKSH